MNILEQIKGRLVVSCQALSDEPLHSSFIMRRTALAAKQGGVVGIHAQNEENIIEIKKVIDLPVIGIVKRSYPDSDIYTTVAKKKLDGLFKTGCEMIAMDAILCDRSNGGELEDFVNYVREHGVLAMTDCSTYEERVNAENVSFDCVSTTLCGYTSYFRNVDGPNLELFKKLVETTKAPILAGDKTSTPEDLAIIYEAGAYSAVVGSVITRPRQTAEYFVGALKK